MPGSIKKYIEEYILYSAFTPIFQSSPLRPVLQTCNITSNCFAPKDFVSSLTVLRVLSNIWVVLRAEINDQVFLQERLQKR